MSICFWCCILLSAPPNVAPFQMAHQLNGVIARRVFQSFPACRNIFPAGLLLVAILLYGQRGGEECGDGHAVY